MHKLLTKGVSLSFSCSLCFIALSCSNRSNLTLLPLVLNVLSIVLYFLLHRGRCKFLSVGERTSIEVKFCLDDSYAYCVNKLLSRLEVVIISSLMVGGLLWWNLLQFDL